MESSNNENQPLDERQTAERIYGFLNAAETTASDLIQFENWWTTLTEETQTKLLKILKELSNIDRESQDTPDSV